MKRWLFIIVTMVTKVRECWSWYIPHVYYCNCDNHSLVCLLPVGTISGNTPMRRKPTTYMVVQVGGLAGTKAKPWTKTSIHLHDKTVGQGKGIKPFWKLWVFPGGYEKGDGVFIQSEAAVFWHDNKLFTFYYSNSLTELDRLKEKQVRKHNSWQVFKFLMTRRHLFFLLCKWFITN